MAKALNAGSTQMRVALVTELLIKADKPLTYLEILNYLDKFRLKCSYNAIVVVISSISAVLPITKATKYGTGATKYFWYGDADYGTEYHED